MNNKAKELFLSARTSDEMAHALFVESYLERISIKLVDIQLSITGTTDIEFVYEVEHDDATGCFIGGTLHDSNGSLFTAFPFNDHGYCHCRVYHLAMDNPDDFIPSYEAMRREYAQQVSIHLPHMTDLCRQILIDKCNPLSSPNMGSVGLG